MQPSHFWMMNSWNAELGFILKILHLAIKIISDNWIISYILI